MDKVAFKQTQEIKPVELKFRKLHEDAILPRRWTDGSVGYDVHAYLKSETGRPLTFTMSANSTRNIETGLLIEPPSGYFVMVCSRSGLAKNSLFVANAPGIIDPDYRGELKILLYNGSYVTQWIKHEDRIAQLVLVPVTPLRIVEMTEPLSSTERGAKGFGSTGGV